MSNDFRTEPEQADKHRARKRFGQNFLTDRNIVDNIIRAINPKPNDQLVEIGPGKGAITLPLLTSCPSLQVIELDRDLVTRLQDLQSQHPDLVIHAADALTIDFSQLSFPLSDSNGQLRIVGNLPYNISTPLLFHLLQYRQIIFDMHFMLQKEVVDRLGAKQNNKNYGRLSVMVQYFAQVEDLFPVPPGCFSPAPKVNSAVVRLRPHTKLPYTAKDEALFAKIIATCFQFRRKTLRNSLRKLVDDDIIASLSIDSRMRPENLSVADFVQLSNELSLSQANS